MKITHQTICKYSFLLNIKKNKIELFAKRTTLIVVKKECREEK